MEGIIFTSGNIGMGQVILIINVHGQQSVCGFIKYAVVGADMKCSLCGEKVSKFDGVHVCEPPTPPPDTRSDTAEKYDLNTSAEVIEELEFQLKFERGAKEQYRERCEVQATRLAEQEQEIARLKTALEMVIEDHKDTEYYFSGRIVQIRNSTMAIVRAALQGKETESPHDT